MAQVERAISVSGAEFTPSTTAATQAFSNVNVQTYASDYKYEGVPTNVASANRLTFDYLYGRGWRTVKIPIRWERIQRSLGGALDSTEVSRLTAELDKAQAAGLKVVLDLHNYGLYYLDGSQTSPAQTTNTGYRFPIGSSTVTQAHFADVWSRLATTFAGHAAVTGFHLMNEPQATGGLTRATWYACAQAAVTAIRAVSSTVTIRVGGWNWSDCYNWTVNNPSGGWITDPANNFWYEAHHYFSEAENGDYTTYANALAHAVAQGHTAGSNTDALHTKVLYDLDQFAAWCTARGVPGVIGEVSVPGNTAVSGDQAKWNALLNVYLARCDALAMNVDAWSTGEFYGNTSDPLVVYHASSGGATGVNTTRATAATWEAHPTFAAPAVQVSAAAVNTPYAALVQVSWATLNTPKVAVLSVGWAALNTPGVAGLLLSYAALKAPTYVVTGPPVVSIGHVAVSAPARETTTVYLLSASGWVPLRTVSL